MWRLLKIEFRKNIQYRAYWIMMGLYLIALLGICTGLVVILNNIRFGGQTGLDFSVLPVYHFPDIWQNMSYAVSLWPIKTLPALLIIVLTTNEYSYKTIRQSIINGQSRDEFFLSKYSNVLLISFLSVAIVGLSAILMGYIYTPKVSKVNIFEHANFLVGYLIELLFYLSMAFFLANLVKRSGIAMAIFIFYALFELIITSIYEELAPFMPMSAMRELLPMPFNKYVNNVVGEGFLDVQTDLSWISVLKSSIYTVLFAGASLFMIRKRDL